MSLASLAALPDTCRTLALARAPPTHEARLVDMNFSHPVPYLSLSKNNVISLIDGQSKLPSLVNGITHKL